MKSFQSIYYRRTRRQDISLITEIRLLPESETLDPSEGWFKVDLSLRKGIQSVSPLFLWYKVGKTAGEMSVEERANIITELDILYGQDAPWYGFEKIEPPTLPENAKFDATWLTYRRGVKGTSSELFWIHYYCLISFNSTSEGTTSALLPFWKI